jgi:hypothetical protein
LFAVIAVIAGLFVPAPSLAHSAKKGIGIADLSPAGAARVRALNVAWYYTWSPRPIPGLTGPEFVPMAWGKANELAAVGNQRVPVMLGFNEPDNRNQSNIDADDAASRWSDVQSHAARVGSPAPANLNNGWLDEFMNRANSQGLRVDFVAIHLYGPPRPDWYLQRVDEVWQKYHKPIWITELGVADWHARGRPGANRFSPESVLACMQALLPELEKRSYVERYAWFGAGKFSLTHEQVRTSALFNADGSLTPLGQFYANF